MAYLIGIDDTDNRGSRGTDFRSRQLASEMNLAGFGNVLGITRHQLLVHEDISFTSQNSANCILVECRDPEGLKSFCSNFLKREGLPGCNGGLCIAEEDSVSEEVEEWGRRAKREVLLKDDVQVLADRNNIYCAGVCGDHNGIIGAMAAIGLRKTGNDGRFIWQPGKQLRDMQGTMSVEELLKGTLIDDVISREGKILGPEEMIDLTDWVRAVLINKKTYILAERNLKRSGSDWITAGKEYIRSLSS